MLFRLPVSGREIALRQPAGAEDLLLAESQAVDTGLAVRLLSLLAAGERGGPVDWLSLPLTDLEAAVLRVRQLLLGESIRSDTACSASGCGARVDIGFRVTDYLAHNMPGPAEGAAPSPEEPWLSLVGTEWLFRVPTTDDHLAARGEPDPEAALFRRCVRPEGSLAPEVQARLEEALEQISPSLFSEVEGQCPECGARVSAMFDPITYVLRELRRQATSVFEEVHVLAAWYHWSERDILSMPRTRRARYAELLQPTGG